jgi:hypothetical protein
LSEKAKAVTRGLDPRVHHLRKKFFAKRMECRIKPGNDNKGLEQESPISIG